MSASRSPIERRPAVPQPRTVEAGAAGQDPASARRAADALDRLRSQLSATQDVLDDFLVRLDEAGRTDPD
ncbi:hypothetical protein [Patulibacter minatonensis]|uniref:hypothetical protein n=1 Tax=Patulibacter minatonensis TaxID=298163 RepID=UPI00047E66E8|nr:hypothetical protein [Patulibacter minatonensis]